MTNGMGNSNPGTKRGEARLGGLKKLRGGSELREPCGNCHHQRYAPCSCKRSKSRGGTQGKGE